MTTFFAFVASTQQNYQFQPELDGQIYNCIVTWSLAGQRYYLNVYALDGTLIVSLPLIGSAVGVDVESAAWTNGIVTLDTESPHGWNPGLTFPVNVSGMEPEGYNGVVNAFISSRSQIQYPLAADPGGATRLGTISYDINLVGGYFTSRLVYRIQSGQFEVSP